MTRHDHIHTSESDNSLKCEAAEACSGSATDHPRSNAASPPQNCLIRVGPRGREALVTDFGLAREVVELPVKDPDRKLSLVGSAFWMAPEMLRGEPYDRKVGPRTGILTGTLVSSSLSGLSIGISFNAFPCRLLTVEAGVPR